MRRPQSATLPRRPAAPATASDVPISLKPLASTWRTTTSDFGASIPRPATAGASRPKWEHEEKKVLRFFSYFKEPVHEGGSNDSRSGFRIRQCTISFYLQDNSVSIDEQKTLNSGLPQGRFMRRMKLFKRGTKVRLEFYFFLLTSLLSV